MRYIALMGDSILQMSQWPLGGYGCLPLVIGGFKTADVAAIQLPALKALLAPNFSDGSPTVAGLLLDCGRNDMPAIQAGTDTFNAFTARYASLVDGILSVIPAGKIMTCCPSMADNNPYIQGVGAEVAGVSQARGIVACSMASLLTDPADYADGTHMSTQGWEKVQPVFLSWVNSLT